MSTGAFNRGTALRFGSALITALYCTTCKAETYHRHGACIHCKTVRPVAPIRLESEWHNSVSKGSRRKKRRARG